VLQQTKQTADNCGIMQHSHECVCCLPAAVGRWGRWEPPGSSIHNCDTCESPAQSYSSAAATSPAAVEDMAGFQRSLRGICCRTPSVHTLMSTPACTTPF
jgi:hypothetical protein